MPLEEGTELSNYASQEDSPSGPPPPSTTSNTSNSLSKRISSWWATNISIVLPMDSHDPRDHLALERTFLAYLRTANAVVLLAVFMAQLYVLRERNFLLGKVISSVATGIGILIALLGGAHFMRQQSALLRGKVVCEGEILWTVFVLVGTISVAMFAIVIAAG